MKDIEKSFNNILNEFNNYTIEDKLKIISNLIFKIYPELYKEDILWNKLKVPELSIMEDYQELIDMYGFHKDESYVYKVLDSGHNLLAMSLELNKKKNNK